jgi:haloacetate dehalogenase
MYAGFRREVVETGESRVALVRGGEGHPVLLLHGFPQTRAAWHEVAPRLARRFHVVVPDLPGYGESPGPLPDDRHESYSKRALARTLVGVMAALGLTRFAVVGHDRGGRVAYRMALDRSDVVTHLGVLDVIPTLEMAEAMSHELALRTFNWFLLAQPAPLPETLIGRASDFYVNQLLDGWRGVGATLSDEARAEYLHAFRNPDVLRAACEDYRAGAGIDLEHDRRDREEVNRIACPALVLWSASGVTGTYFDPMAIWRRWATDVRGRALECGHFLPEEAADVVAEAVEALLAAGGD